MEITKDDMYGEADICVHGLSLWLCMGPNHYPTVQDEMEGRYY